MLHLVRFLFLLGALGAGAVAWVWHDKVDWVQTFEARWIATENHGLERRVQELRKNLGSFDENYLVDELLYTLEQIGEVQLGDRNFGTWRRTVSLLSHTYKKYGRHVERIQLLSTALQRDPRNIPLVCDLALALVDAGPTETDKAQAFLDKWLKKLPAHPKLLEAQVILWLPVRPLEEIEAHLATQLPKSTRYWLGGWSLQALDSRGNTVGKPLKGTLKPSPNGLGPTSQFYLQTKTPTPALGASFFRITPPTGFCADFRLLGFEFVETHAPRNEPGTFNALSPPSLAPSHSAVHHMQVLEDEGDESNPVSLRTSGKAGAYFSFAQDAPLSPSTPDTRTWLEIQTKPSLRIQRKISKAGLKLKKARSNGKDRDR